MIYFSDPVSSVTASVTVKRHLESEANTKIKWKQSGIMSALLVSVVNVLSRCVCLVTQVIYPGAHACTAPVV